MKSYLIIILAAFSPALFGGELPAMLRVRIDQMKLLGGQVEAGANLSAEWPDKASGLFQGIRKGVDKIILTKEDHLAAIASIPKHLMRDHIVGETVESGGWFYTSIEHASWTNKEATWFSVIASTKNSKVLCFSYSW